ncbi:MAG: helix-turn-helix domain-containing protein [Cyanobacteria bacterium SBLK]|nr:helix-turn-helix domain-containing protein [Cyanobacteria bacterium SBLK]
MTLKILLKELREGRGLSQNQLANKIEMSPQTIQKIEQGIAKSLTFETLDRLCIALDCDPGDIIVRERSEENATSN